MIKLGNDTLEYGIMLAPMAGFSDRAMRLLCHEYGAEWLVTEMVSAKATVYRDKKTALLSRIYPDEGRVALQIFGSEPEVMAEAAGILSLPVAPGCAAPSAIDINMGCPVNKIFTNGEGSALMKSPSLIYDIVRATVGATALPVTVKLRIGVDENHINAVECALAAEEGGAELITVHGRTRAQMYSGEVNREIIKNVKDSLHIPVIANGDILSGADALSMLSDTGADGIAIGRGAVGNPFIFREVICALEGETFIPPTLEEKVKIALLQLRLAIEDKGERVAVPESRKQIASYLHSFKGAAAIRARINLATEYSVIERILTEALTEENT